MLTWENKVVNVDVNQINSYQYLKQLVMYLGVRKPVDDANRSGYIHEIPDVTWTIQAEERFVISQEWSNGLFRLNYSQAGWYHGKSSLLHNSSRDFFYTKG